MKILDWLVLSFDRDPKTMSSRKPSWHAWYLPVLVVSVSLYLYVRLFASFGVPYFVAADQAFFWEYGLRMLHGEHVYKDFFQFTAPGTDLYFLLLFKMFGARVWVGALGTLLLGASLGITCFELSRRFMSAKEALFTSLFFTVFVYGGRLDATHHWFSLIASLTAVAVLFKDRSIARILLAGSLLGVASFFTQTSGVFAGMAILLALAWEHEYGKPWKSIIRDQVLLISSFCVVWLAINAHFIVTAGWRSLWYDQVIYPWFYVDAHRGFLIPTPGGSGIVLSQRLFLYSLLVLLCPYVLLICFRRRKKTSSQDMPSVLLALAGVLLLVSILTRSNWARLYPVSMPSIILGMSLITRWSRQHRRNVLIALCIVTVCAAAFQIRADRRRKVVVMDLPGGRMEPSDSDAEVFRWLQANTKPGDDFFQAIWPGIYLPLGLQSPVFVETLLPGRTPPEFVSLTIRQLQKGKTKYILWSQYLRRDPHNQYDDGIEPFRNYLKSNYVRIYVFSNSDEIWQRRQM